MKEHNIHENKHKGAALFTAVVIVSFLLVVTLSIFNVALKNLKLSGYARQSVQAIYAADTGIGCGLYWDIRGVEAIGELVFATSTDSSPPTGNVSCVGNNALQNKWDVNSPAPPTASAATTTFDLDIVVNPPGPGNTERRCALVTVAKYTDASSILHTSIVSRGYNTQCGTVNDNTVERVLRVDYQF